MTKTRVVLYAVAASAAVAFGLLLIRAEVTPQTLLAAELRTSWFTYLYVFVATAGASLLLGHLLGTHADELWRLSMIDPLTGLANRRALQLRLRDECRRTERYGQPLALLLIDVDHLKTINDTLGHHCGDRALRTVAAAIRATLRETDAGARWGGDEFAIVAPNTASRAAQRLGHRLLLQMRKAPRVGSRRVTLSIGVAVLDPAQRPLETADDLMRAADAALYQAKLHGRDQVRAA